MIVSSDTDQEDCSNSIARLVSTRFQLDNRCLWYADYAFHSLFISMHAYEVVKNSEYATRGDLSTTELQDLNDSVTRKDYSTFGQSSAQEVRQVQKR